MGHSYRIDDKHYTITVQNLARLTVSLVYANKSKPAVVRARCVVGRMRRLWSWIAKGFVNRCSILVYCAGKTYSTSLREVFFCAPLVSGNGRSDNAPQI